MLAVIWRLEEAIDVIRRVLLKASKWFFVVVAAFHLVCALNLLYLRWMNPFFTTVQIQRRVEAIVAGRDYEEHRDYLALSEIPKTIQHAVIVAEDGRFYQHSGIDWQELRKVIAESRQQGELGRGASTITQQLVKNLFLTTHRSAARKAFEFTLAPLAEIILGKERILELYLNVIEWGTGVYGIEAAARYHYRLPAAHINREQAARLAACIPLPRSRRPHQMNQYAALILERMSKQGW